MASNDLKSSLGQLEDTLNDYLVKRAPFQIPPNGKEAIVNFGPWITLVLLVISVPIIIAALGLTAILSPFAFMGGGVYAGLNFMLGGVVLLVSAILQAVAIPKLMHRQKSGWNLVFYSSLMNILASLLRFDIVGALIGGLLGLYILFQVREYYK